MIVDCHTHIDIGQGDCEQSKHIASAETVDKCIVLASPDGPGEKSNKAVSDYIGSNRAKMIGFGVVEPRTDKVGTKSIESMRDKLGLSGAVLYCSDCGFHPAHSRAMRFYASAQELDMPVFFHNGFAKAGNGLLRFAQPVLLDEVASEFSNMKIIIGSMGMPFIEQTLLMIGTYENVYADLTIRPGNVWQVYNMVVAAHEQGVMDKLLFGSGFPAATAGECIETLLGFNKLLGDTNLPIVPRGKIRNVVERDTLEILGIK